jgi:hypothetical protein
MSEDLLVGYRRILARNYKGSSDLAPERICNSNHDYFGNSRTISERSFYFARKNILSAGNEHLLPAPAYPVSTGFIFSREVTGSKPAIRRERFRSLFRRVEIFAEELGSAKQKFADFIITDILELFVYKPHLEELHGSTHTPRGCYSLLSRHRETIRPALRQTIPEPERIPSASNALGKRERTRRATGDEPP